MTATGTSLGAATRLALLLATLLVTLTACEAPADDDSNAGAPAVVTDALLDALTEAQALHHAADRQLAAGDRAAAAASVARVLEVRFPPGATDGDDVLLDARARLARLHLAAGEVAAALTVIDAGLTAPRESFFLGNLHMVAGEAHVAHADTLRATDAVAADHELRAGLRAYERSIAIMARVQQRILEENRR
ncbi:MAG: hypothetical protein EXR73_07450 [Myxococcales bacterium]|nr:hypothetical protein [Myxococcales bacterium]